MGKFKPTLVTVAKQKEEDQREQLRLRKKYNIPENIHVVEKNNFLKLLLKCFRNVVKLVSTIIIVLLAFMGLTSIVYPNVRSELLKIYISIWNELLVLLNM